MLAVVALGGNAILPKGARGTPGEQWATARRAAKNLIPILDGGSRLVITHGNGPQVGYLLEAMESLPEGVPRQTLDIAVAMTQGWIGYLIAHSIDTESRGRYRPLVVVSRVVVSRRDPAFSNPTKFVGRYYTREEAEVLARERGWVMKRDPRGGYRRVVPSPRPQRILEAPLIREAAINLGVVVVGVGGGGIPVDEELNPVEAVVDKDLASYRLAVDIGAEKLVILTDVPGVALNYGTPREEWLRRLEATRALELVREGVFPPGSMGPKVEAAARFALETGRPAAIGKLEEAHRVFNGEAGTLIIPD